MTDDIERVHLFCIANAAAQSELNKKLKRYGLTGSHESHLNDDLIKQYVAQFESSNVYNAKMMSEYYEIFYMLENDIRGFISSILEDAVGEDWWDKCVPPQVKSSAKHSMNRELQQGVTLRSTDSIVYTTFGELGEIIKSNLVHFEGLLANQQGVESVLSRLNTLRGPIAHCGVLSEDEGLRLKLSVRDWFRLMEQ